MAYQNELQEYYHLWFGMDDLYREWAKRKGLTFNSLFVLMTIQAEGGSCRISRLIQQLQLPKQTVSTILDSLEKKGMIQRLENEADRRGRVAAFGGSLQAPELLAEMNRLEELAMERLGAARRKELLNSTAAFYDELKKVLEE